MSRPIRLSLLTILAVFAGGAARVTLAQPLFSPEASVRSFVAAFNARDLDGMLAIADDGIEWGSVDGAKVTIQDSGKEALRASMTGYFASCPSCLSTLEWVSVAGSRVAAFERSSWQAKDGSTKSQASLSVYEFAGDKIVRVYYFPTEP